MSDHERHQLQGWRARRRRRGHPRFHSEAADRDAALRQVMVDKLTELIADSGTLSERQRRARRPALHPATSAPLPAHHRRRAAAAGQGAVAAEAKLEGKFLLRCSDPAMSAEDIALGYQQLLAVERGWRDLKTHLSCARSTTASRTASAPHVLLCRLALLPVRIIETHTGRTWDSLREDLQDLHVGVFTGSAGTLTQTSEPTTATKPVLAALELTPPEEGPPLRPRDLIRRRTASG